MSLFVACCFASGADFSSHSIVAGLFLLFIPLIQLKGRDLRVRICLFSCISISLTRNGTRTGKIFATLRLSAAPFFRVDLVGYEQGKRRML